MPKIKHMKSFHNDQKIKDKYIARIKEHMEADRIIKGEYWEDGKGCAVGCTIEGSDHSKYEADLGLPEWLAHVEDVVFEGLPNHDAMKFPLQFLEAIPVGITEDSFEALKYNLNSQRLEILLDKQKELYPGDDFGVNAALQKVIDLCNTYLSATEDEWSEAWSAAHSAANSAGSAANSAAHSSWSARSAERSEARSEAWLTERDRLISGLISLK